MYKYNWFVICSLHAIDCVFLILKHNGCPIICIDPHRVMYYIYTSRTYIFPVSVLYSYSFYYIEIYVLALIRGIPNRSFVRREKQRAAPHHHKLTFIRLGAIFIAPVQSCRFAVKVLVKYIVCKHNI